MLESFSFVMFSFLFLVGRLDPLKISILLTVGLIYWRVILDFTGHTFFP